MSRREEFLTQRLAERSAALSQLRGGIQDFLDGDWGRNIPRKVDTCAHGKFGWEACENCIDDYFRRLLQEAASPLPPSHSQAGDK